MSKMEQGEYIKYFSKIDPIDILIRGEEARCIFTKQGLDDALAFAIATGVRIGIKAVLENKEEKQ